MTVIEILNAVVPCGKRSVLYVDTLVLYTFLMISDYVSFGENVVKELDRLLGKSLHKVKVGSHFVSYCSVVDLRMMKCGIGSKGFGLVSIR